MLLIIELILGILCGIFLSLYVPSMVKIGIAEIYGYLTLLTSISTILAYLAMGISLDRGYRFPVVSLAFLGLAIFFLENSMLVMAALIFGAHIGAHYVALLYIASSRTKDLILAHSMGFLGMSLGAMIVLFGAYNPLVSILSLIALGYYRLLKPVKIEKIEKPMSKREFCLIFSILGLAIGLSTMNVDYHLAMKFEAEREIDSFKLHVTSTALQAVIYGLTGFTQA